MLMLHIGCGDVHFDGWVNIDIASSKADLLHDLRTPLPYEENSVDFIYNEHFIEHFAVTEGLQILSECFRVLRKGGILRIATIDLRHVLLKYFFFWRKQDWIKEYGYEWLKTRTEMVNLCFREWGHQYMYDREELTRRLREVGFHNIRKQRRNKSSYKDLLNRETRKDSRLILEASK